MTNGLTYGLTDLLTWVGARDTCVSKNGIKFDEQQFVMMANQYEMETKKVDNENMEEGP